MSDIPKPEIQTSADPTVTRIIPDLAEEIGLNESIVLLQVGFWIKQSTQLIDGHWWTFQSAQDMKNKAFRYWSISTINRILNRLVEQELLIEANYNQKKYDRTRWFALNVPNLAKLKSITVMDRGITSSVTETQNEKRQTQNEKRENQFEKRQTQNEKPIPEIPTETPKEKKEKESLASDDAPPPKTDSQRNKDAAAILKAHLDSGVIWSKKKPIYALKGYRDKAEAILDAGITPQQVQDYIHYQKTRTDDPFWHDKSISLEHLLKSVKPWVQAQEEKAKRAETATFEPESPAHIRYIAPDPVERGPYYEQVQQSLQDLLNLKSIDRVFQYELEQIAAEN